VPLGFNFDFVRLCVCAFVRLCVCAFVRLCKVRRSAPATVLWFLEPMIFARSEVTASASREIFTVRGAVCCALCVWRVAAPAPLAATGVAPPVKAEQAAHTAHSKTRPLYSAFPHSGLYR
jgi:hypothetical protein